VAEDLLAPTAEVAAPAVDAVAVISLNQ